MVINDPKIENPVLKMVGETADQLDLECYVIGGWVRDLILHRPSDDIDIVVVGSGITLAEAVAKKIGKKAHLSVFKTYGTAQVKRGDLELEFVGARRESYTRDSRNPIVEDGTLEEDQNRRDFTINAMAICLNNSHYGELLDPFDGIGIITKERIAEELNKIMLSRRPSEGWLLLDKTGLLPLIFPELAALKGIDVKEGRGHKDVFFHTLKVLDNVAELTSERMNDLTNERKDKVLWLRWAALLHDIGKPRSKQWDPQVGLTFRNHNYLGAKMVPKIFAKMKLPLNEKMEYVRKMVDLHMRPINLIEDTVTDSAVRRLLFEAGDDIDDLMLLCDADITSRNEEKKARFHRNYQLVREKMVELEERDRIRNFQPPVDGMEIMELFHLEPCSLVGELKAAIKEAILDGIIPNDHDAAKAFVLELWQKKTK